jgi:arylsulfatase A-like enzyme
MEEGYYGHIEESSSESILHVPLFFYCPKIFKSKSISAPVSTIDIFPTITDLLNQKISYINMGVTLKEILLETQKKSLLHKTLWERPIYSEAWNTKNLLDRNPGYSSDKKIFTIRKAKYKLKIIREKKNENTIIEKFDLINWVTKEKVSIKDNDNIFEEYLHLLYSHINETSVISKKIMNNLEKEINKDAQEVFTKEDEERIKQRLRSLGYLE